MNGGVTGCNAGGGYGFRTTTIDECEKGLR